jgi:HD-GYP domain-containing protein (c-di-GMP phosphodiesterase class II)
VPAVVSTINEQSQFAARHSERVAEIAVIMGRALGLDEDELERLRWSALLHDVGKLWVPEDILGKRGPLRDDEWEVLRSHPLHSAWFIEQITQFFPYYDAALHHHERYDGTGYPDGLAGHEIPFHARILAIADALEAMTSDRPYRPGMTLSEARQELLEHAGKQFDPEIVAETVRMIDSCELDPFSLAPGRELAGRYIPAEHVEFLAD